ncbi:MAG: ribonuclease P protein component [Lachnospiraceae bacterium]|nr:ribonuclease P protein component [Lachnospiraceae bacterium]
MRNYITIKKNEDFRKVYGARTSKANRLLIMYIQKNGTNENRFGISVSKKIGNSIVRHRLTRVIRECIRRNTDSFVSGYDIVIVARPDLKGCGYVETLSALLHVSKIHGILKKDDVNG